MRDSDKYTGFNLVDKYLDFMGYLGAEEIGKVIQRLKLRFESMKSLNALR